MHSLDLSFSSIVKLNEMVKLDGLDRSKLGGFGAREERRSMVPATLSVRFSLIFVGLQFETALSAGILVNVDGRGLNMRGTGPHAAAAAPAALRVGWHCGPPVAGAAPRPHAAGCR